MALDSPKFIAGLQAGGDLSSDQFKLVERHTTANQVVVCNAVTDYPIGVLYNKPDAAGKGADVAAIAGGTIVKVKVGSGGVSAGDEVAPNSSGLLIPTTTTGHFSIGTVLQDYSENDLAEVHCNFHELA